MQSVAVSGKSIVLGVLVSGVFCVSVMLSPTQASAQTAVQTQQLLPPGQNTCQMVTVADVEPHVYGGELESFDLTLSSDTSHSYVGVLAQVGNTSVPLDFITRWAGNPSGTRIHVDTPNMAVGSGVPVNVTLLASLPGQPTCITSISFEATNSGNLAAYVPPSTQVPPPGSTSSASSASASPASGGGSGKGNGSGVSAASSSTGATSTGGIVTASVSGSMNLFNNVCAGSNAYRLWFILLAIYVVIVAIVVFAEPWFLQDSVLASTATVLVPLILLLLFWYFSEACRAASWIPVIACVIAIIGLFLAFREYETPQLLAAPSDR